MRIKITKPGIFTSKGEIEVGTELDMKNEPKGWAGRYEVIGRTAGKTAVNNDEPRSYEDMTRAELDALAAERKVDVSAAKNKGDVIAALRLAEAGKAE